MERFGQNDDSPSKPTIVQRIGPMMLRFQTLIVKRLWSIIVLTALSRVGGMLAARAWGDEHKGTGENLTYAILITLGVVGYWIWPTRVRVMRRLCTLLLLGGSIVLVVTFVLSLRASGWQLGDGWRGMADYMLVHLGWRWLISGGSLGALLMVGPIVRSRRADRRKKQESKPAVPAMQPSTPPSTPQATPDSTEPSQPEA